MSVTNYEQPLQTQCKWLILLIHVIKLSRQCTVGPLGCLYCMKIVWMHFSYFKVRFGASIIMEKKKYLWLFHKSSTESCAVCFHCAISESGTPDLWTCTNKLYIQMKQTFLQLSLKVTVHLFGGWPVADWSGKPWYTGSTSLLQAL